ncbi:MAG: phage Gp37/Gp68 family protein [Proteobacteria bacterium]|nr:phage Gp37/Gp68 family protein [Pseudomonadota bacterium]
MAAGSTIEWTQATWNPVTGCTKVSPGCKNCYAERMSKRLQAMGVRQYRNAFELAIHPEMLELPLRWRKPRVIFVNSMSDLFQEDIPLEFIQRVFKVMTEAPQHTFQILTKRPEIAADYAGRLPWPDNVWMGTSVENALYVHRVRTLQTIPAKIRFLSVEPLLGAIPRLPLKKIHWVIVGGESGPGARPMEARWVRQIRDQCRAKGVSFFFKQWGGTNKKKTGRLLDGRTWDTMPSSHPSIGKPDYVRIAAAGR